MDDIYIKPRARGEDRLLDPLRRLVDGHLRPHGRPAHQGQAQGSEVRGDARLGSAAWLENVLKPTQQPNTYDDTVELFAALRAKQVDAVAIDMPVALPAAAASDGAIKVYAQVKVGGQVGIVHGAGHTRIARRSTRWSREMLKNGTLKALEKKYYFASFGGVDPDTLPYWG